MYNQLRSAAVLAVALIIYTSCQFRQDRPNLLIIQTDEHNFRTLGCYRSLLPESQAYVWGENIKVETPNIDFLAHNGALCTSYYATTPICSPSRASFMSGRYPQNTPVVTNDIPMADEIVTFAEILSQQGYATGYCGKWHLDGTGKPQWAPQRKFGFEDNRFMFNRGHWKQLEYMDSTPKVASINSMDEPDYGIKGATAQNYTTDFLTERTIDFIKKNKGRSFCYMVSYPDPHGPNTVRSPYDSMFAHLAFQKPQTAFKDTIGLPSWAKLAKKTISSQQMAQYFGMVKCIDDNVGRIIGTLKEIGQLENTIIVFTSDHGDLCGEHGRDNKGNPFEASARIPFLLFYPQKVNSGTIVNEALGTVDFLPTVLALMNIPTQQTEQGRDASSLFLNPSIHESWNDVTFLRGSGARENRPDVNWLAAVTDRYKLIFSPKDEPWFIDLAEDPDEIHNQYYNPEYREAISSMWYSLNDYGTRFNDPRTKLEKFKAEFKEAVEANNGQHQTK